MDRFVRASEAASGEELRWGADDFTDEVCPLVKGCTISAAAVDLLSLPSPPSSSMVSLYRDVQTLQHGDVIPVSTSAASDSAAAKASTATSSVSTKTCVSLSSKSIIQLANVLNRRSGTATSGRITLAPTPPSLTPHRTSASPPLFLADTPSPPDRIRISPTPQSHRHYFLHFHPRRIDELDEHLLRWTGGGCDGCRGGSWASDAVRVDAFNVLR